MFAVHARLGYRPPPMSASAAKAPPLRPGHFFPVSILGIMTTSAVRNQKGSMIRTMMNVLAPTA